MKKIELGPVLFSSRILDAMIADSSFAKAVGESIAQHSQNSKQVLRLGGKIKTTFYTKERKFVIITELDKNQMPRTSVVFWLENGEI